MSEVADMMIWVRMKRWDQVGSRAVYIQVWHSMNQNRGSNRWDLPTTRHNCATSRHKGPAVGGSAQREWEWDCTGIDGGREGGREGRMDGWTDTEMLEEQGRVGRLRRGGGG